ncbi:hypothetical protein HN858_00475 [Candidatus Falkowbacteria bacterium]|nr:hypothetical protein [Candidatus Falkowbacteria bacterium]MBT5503739.1 hypothetical protein [Candidatus Falkowbacteria bacterium]MBT6573782.1 hypothetical protein [Candidatus Falkowbacteria bacterium]MBT7348128.1 hypothetical protein [Candidatus Falkowbacteria bacterium]MBT7500714.1 hypothetical protein [Candidatus Falkowbacteria bacterium]
MAILETLAVVGIALAAMSGNSKTKAPPPVSKPKHSVNTSPRFVDKKTGLSIKR